MRMIVIYSEEMKNPMDIVIRYTSASPYAKWHILYNGVVQDTAATAERALEAAARFIISNMTDDDETGEMRIRWTDVPAGFTPPDASALAPIIEDDVEPVH
jgi:hypothetical protein